MSLVGRVDLLSPSVDVVRLAIEGGRALAALASASLSTSASASASALESTLNINISMGIKSQGKIGPLRVLLDSPK